MKQKIIKVLYVILLTIGLLGFILHIFVFESPDGNLGFVLCLVEVSTIICSTIRLWQLSKSFREGFSNFIKIFFGF